MAHAAIFLDRDGVINKNRPDHVKSWSEFRFARGSLKALSELSQLPSPIIVITNQAVINRGIVTHKCVDDIHRRMIGRIERAGGRVDGVFYCPHRPDEACNCRKPEPGLFLRAARQFDIDLSRSVFVGDALSDILAGQKAGCATILILTGRGQETFELLKKSPTLEPAAIADDLLGAVPLMSDMISRKPSTAHQQPAGHLEFKIGQET